MRLKRKFVENEYGTYEVYKYDSENEVCLSCTECKNKCRFGYKTVEMIIEE